MTKICFIGDIHGKKKSPSNRLTDYNIDLFNQLEWVKNYCNQNQIEYIIHLGDIFDTPDATDEWKNKFIELWKSYNGTFYSIIGAAHDLFYNQKNSYDKTCLRNLELSGVIKVLKSNDYLSLNEAAIYSLSPYIDEAKEQLKNLNLQIDKCNIIVGHQFYNWNLDESISIVDDDFVNINANCSLILGHDHHQYNNVLSGNITIYRPGSFMRTELSEATINMTPRVLIYNSGVFEYVNVPCRNINEIYNVSEYMSKKNKLFKQIKNNIENISKYLDNQNVNISCSKYLMSSNCPSDEFEYLKSVHQVCNQEF